MRPPSLGASPENTRRAEIRKQYLELAEVLPSLRSSNNIRDKCEQ